MGLRRLLFPPLSLLKLPRRGGGDLDRGIDLDLDLEGLLLLALFLGGLALLRRRTIRGGGERERLGLREGADPGAGEIRRLRGGGLRLSLLPPPAL